MKLLLTLVLLKNMNIQFIIKKLNLWNIKNQIKIVSLNQFANFIKKKKYNKIMVNIIGKII